MASKKSKQQSENKLPTKRRAGPTVNDGVDSKTKRASRKGVKPPGPPKESPPILGDLDLHLFGEGKHYRIYEKLGAPILTHGGKRGVTFAVWAPAADRVSVVGNFNSWDATKHPMRRLGISGVWEIFIPGLRAGELYKYVITTA